MSTTEEIINRMNTGKFDATRAGRFDLERAKGSLTSAFTVERLLNVDEENRTAEFAFATDQPIEHWFGYLELDVSKGAVVLDRVEQGVCPFLVNHDRDQQVGVVQSVTLGKVIRGTVKFSRSALGEEIFNDVKDGIRNGTSIGFMVHDMVLVSNKKDEIPTYRATKWEMLENSSASIPADIACGAGRSLEKEIPETDKPEEILDTNSSSEERSISTQTEKIMAKENEETPGTPVVDNTRSAALEAAREIAAFGDIFGEPALAREVIAAGGSVDDFRTAVRTKQKQAPAVTVPVETAEDVATRQGGNVQLARTLPRYGTLKNFTGEGAAERAYRFGQWFLGVRGIPAATKFCQERGIALIRAQQEGVNESGGFLVPEEFGNDLIDLREMYGAFRKNAKMVPMASDTRSDPRRTGGLTAYFVGESGAGTASDKAWDRVSLTAKKLFVLARYSSEINEDAVINMGDDLAGEIAYAFAVKEDNCGFIGDGSSTYGGMQGVTTKIKGLHATIANIAGLVVATGTGYATSYGSTVLTDFEAVVGKLPVFADTPRAKWYCHKTYYWNVMAKLVLAAGGVTGAEIEGSRVKRFLGYDVEFVQVMPKDPAVSQVCALLGDLSMAASFGSRRDTTIAISEHSRFANDEIEIRGTERFDINVHDVGNASATAGSRVTGPIVGLITAAS
jgi:HK97 family phage major capsid protein